MMEEGGLRFSTCKFIPFNRINQSALTETH